MGVKGAMTWTVLSSQKPRSSLEEVAKKIQSRKQIVGGLELMLLILLETEDSETDFSPLYSNIYLSTSSLVGYDEQKLHEYGFKTLASC